MTRTTVIKQSMNNVSRYFFNSTRQHYFHNVSKLSTTHKLCSFNHNNNNILYNPTRYITEFIQSRPTYKPNDNIHIQHDTSNDTVNVTPQSHMHIKATHMIALFTCNKCDHRQSKTINKQSYNHGVVLCRCDKCMGLHLFADHLGWFDHKSVTIEDICKQHNIKLTNHNNNNNHTIDENDQQLIHDALHKHYTTKQQHSETNDHADSNDNIKHVTT